MTAGHRTNSKQNCLFVWSLSRHKYNKPIQWTLANPNSLGPEHIQIGEIFGLVKATAATCVIVTAPYLLGIPAFAACSQNTQQLPNYLLALCWYTSRAKHDLYTQILIIDQLVLGFGFARFRINAIRTNVLALECPINLKFLFQLCCMPICVGVLLLF